jgi:hypothetical protein
LSFSVNFTAAILEELDYLNEKKGEDKKNEVRAKETNENNLKNGGEEQQREKQLIYSCLTPEIQ